MNTFMLTVSTPDGTRFRDRVYMLSLQGSEGSLAVLSGHIPMMTAVLPGECRVELPDGSERIGVLREGLLSVASEETTLLSSEFSWKE